MKILVIGGFGYVGSALVSHLVQKGITAIPCGKRDQDYNKLTAEYLNSFDRIVLLAGHSSVPMCMGPLKSSWLNNVKNFKDLVEKVDPVIPIIYASSSSVYSNSGSYPSKENELSLEYVNNYDLTKTFLDLYALDQIRLGHCLIGLRFGTVNGASTVLRKELMINSMVYNAVNTGSISITNKHVNRPLLGMNDLVMGIESIVRHSNYELLSRTGPYNMASFNTNVEQIAIAVKDILKVDIVDNGSNKGVYDFSIDCNKFTKAFSFTFHDTPEIIINQVKRAYEDTSIQLVSRTEYFEYGG